MLEFLIQIMYELNSISLMKKIMTCKTQNHRFGKSEIPTWTFFFFVLFRATCWSYWSSYISWNSWWYCMLSINIQPAFCTPTGIAIGFFFFYGIFYPVFLFKCTSVYVYIIDVCGVFSRINSIRVFDCKYRRVCVNKPN